MTVRRVVGRLTAPEPGWSVSADVVVIGSGIAGPTAALRPRGLVDRILPTFRALQKYAVRCGGGVNHRFGLSDRAMVKDDHVVAAGGVVPAYELVRESYPGLRVEVEATDLDQLRELLEAGCTEILLDNMDTVRWPRRSASPPVGRRSRPPAGAPSTGLASWRGPAWTSSRRAPLPTRSRLSTWGWT